MHWPTEKDAIQKEYADHGFVVLRRLLAPEKVEELRANLDRYIVDVVPTLPAMDAFFEQVVSKRAIRMLPRMERHDAFFQSLLNDGLFPQIAETLCGTTVVGHDAAYFNKLPRIGDLTPPHQDGYYFHLDPCRALTLWLALDEVDDENGCIHYVRGSHKKGLRGHVRTDVLGFSQGISDYGSAEDRRQEVAACAAAGDLIAHDALTIHRADRNRSSRPRRALGFVYFAAEAKVDTAARDQYQQELALDWQSKGKI